MTGAVRILAIELRRGAGGVLAAGVAVTGTVLLFVHPDDWAGHWLGLAVYLRGSLILLVPLAAAVACWQAGRERRRGIGELLTSAPRPGWQPLVAGSAPLTLAAVAGLLVTFGVGAAFVGPRASYSGGGWAWVGLGAILPLAAAVALGFTVGRVVPSRLIGLPLALALYVLLALPGYMADAGSLWLTPLVEGDFSGSRLTASTHAWQALWFAGLTLTLTGVTALAGRPAARRSLVATVVAGAVVALGAASALATGPGFGRWQPDPPARRLVCSTTGPPVCLIRADAFLLDDVAAAFQPPLRRLAGVPGAPVRAIGPGNGESVPGDAIELNQLPVGATGRFDPTSQFGDPVRDTVQSRLGWWSCGPGGAGPGDETDAQMARANTATELVTAWVLGPAPITSTEDGASLTTTGASLPAVTAGLGRLNEQSAPAQRAWIGAYLAARENCDDQALSAVLARLGAP